MTLKSIVTGSGHGTPQSSPSKSRTKSTLASLTPKTLVLANLFHALSNPEIESAHIIEAMTQHGVNATFLETLPEGIALPLREVLMSCQEDPPTTWSEGALETVGREDLKMLLNPHEVIPEYQKSQAVSRYLVFLIFQNVF